MRPDEPVWCPSDDGGTRGDWDARELLGLELDGARRLAAENGCSVRVAIEDGDGLELTADFTNVRVNVATEDDVVVALQDVG